MVMTLVVTACGGDTTSAFCEYLEENQDDLLFDVEMSSEAVLATTQRAQEVYAEAADLAPDDLRPFVERGVSSWANLERRFGEAFNAGLSSEEAFNAILVEWETLVDVPANDRVVAFVAAECGPSN